MRNIFFLIFWCLSPFCFAQGNFGNVKVLINLGNSYTNELNGTVKIRASNAVKAMISNQPDLRDAHWVPYQEIVNWILPSGDGEKKVYVKLMDDKGNESDVFSDAIILDTTPPQNASIKIQTENGFSNNPKLEVSFQVKADEARYMMISNHKSFYGENWRAYQEKIENWRLDGDDDGHKYIFVKFRDAAGNESPIFTDQVVIDRVSPMAGEVFIDNNNPYCTNKDRLVKVFAVAKGADQMKISTSSTFEGSEWVNYKSETEFQLPEGDGPKMIYVKFRDLAGNESETYKDDILLDTTPPENCTVSINGGTKLVENLDGYVDLHLSSTDAVLMMISNDPNFKGARWVGFTDDIKWQLSAGEGDRSVYVLFKDKAGNVSGIKKASVKLVRK